MSKTEACDVRLGHVNVASKPWVDSSPKPEPKLWSGSCDVYSEVSVVLTCPKYTERTSKAKSPHLTNPLAERFTNAPALS